MNTISSLLHFILTKEKQIITEQEGFLNKFYPVGTVYMTINPDFNPGTTWGGTWTLESEGYAIMSGSKSGSYKVGTNYGSVTKSYTPGGSVSTSVGGQTVGATTLNANQSGLRSHAHSTLIYAGSGSTAAGNAPWSAYAGGSRYDALAVNAANASASHTHTVTKPSVTASFSGTRADINVIQPSRTYYIWRRTA